MTWKTRVLWVSASLAAICPAPSPANEPLRSIYEILEPFGSSSDLEPYFRVEPIQNTSRNLIRLRGNEDSGHLVSITVDARVLASEVAEAEFLDMTFGTVAVAETTDGMLVAQFSVQLGAQTLPIEAIFRDGMFHVKTEAQKGWFVKSVLKEFALCRQYDSEWMCRWFFSKP